MTRIVLTFGLISGGILAAMMAITLLAMKNTLDFENSELIGYTTMVLSFLAVFFGIRTYRENAGGGAITFGRAFKVGILIALISCAIYVIAWQIIYYNFVPDFMDRYAAFTLEKLRADGASAAKIAEETTKMARFKELYKNPFINVGFTFIEVFPVGLIMTLISAAILRKKPAVGMPATAIA